MPLEKAKRFLGAAECCSERGFYDSCASRCYYAVYRAAIVALEDAGFGRPHWNHGTLKRMFDREWIEKREQFSMEHSNLLRACYDQRVIADYKDEHVAEETVERLIPQGLTFIEAVEEVISNG